MQKQTLIRLTIFIIVFFNYTVAKANFGLLKSKPHFAADQKLVRSVKCKYKAFDLDEFQSANIDQIFEPSHENRSYYYGYYEFKQQSDLALELFKVFFKNEMPKLHRVCQSVKCLLERSFGSDWKLYVWFYQRYNINLSPYALESSAQWNNSDLYLLLETIQNLPPYFFPLPHTIRIGKESDPHAGRLYPGHYAHFNTAKNSIKLLPLWKRQSYIDQVITLTHEIAHAFGDIFSLHYHPDWSSLSQWHFNKKKGEYYSKDKNSIVSRYGETDPAEDFAETLVAYRYNPEQLKKMSAAKYQYMKELVFGGLEYDSKANCLVQKSYYHQAFPEDALDFQKLEKKCEFDLIKFFAKRGPLEGYIACLDQNFYLIESRALQSDFSGRAKYQSQAETHLEEYPNLKYQLKKTDYLNGVQSTYQNYYNLKYP